MYLESEVYPERITYGKNNMRQSSVWSLINVIIWSVLKQCRSAVYRVYFKLMPSLTLTLLERLLPGGVNILEF